MAVSIKQLLGLNTTDEILRNLKIPESMLGEQPNPFAKFARPPQSPAQETPAQAAARSVTPLSPEDTGHKGAYDDSFTEEDLAADRAPAAVENAEDVDPELLAAFNAPATAEVAPPEVSGDVSLDDAGALPKTPAAGKSADSENFLDKFLNASKKVDLSPWAALVDRYAGSKLAQVEIASAKQRSDISQQEQMLMKDALQQKRLDAYNGKAMTDKLAKVTENYLDSKSTVDGLKDAFKIVNGKVSYQRVNAALSQLLVLNQVKGAQTEGDIARQWASSIEKLMAGLKTFFMQDGEHLKPSSVKALVQQANVAAKLASEKAKEKINYYQDAYVANGLSPEQSAARAKAAAGIVEKNKYSPLDESLYGSGAAGDEAKNAPLTDADAALVEEISKKLPPKSTK
jgi:hypothetical protein